MNQPWKSKETGIEVTVIKITDEVVWWEDPKNWVFPQHTTKERFFATMEPEQTVNIGGIET